MIDGARIRGGSRTIFSGGAEAPRNKHGEPRELMTCEVSETKSHHLITLNRPLSGAHYQRPQKPHYFDLIPLDQIQRVMSKTLGMSP